MTTGYVFRHEEDAMIPSNCIGAVRHTVTFIDWESAAETVEQVMDYVRQYHDGFEGSVVRFTAEIEPVASVVWPDEECEKHLQASLFD